MDVKNLTPSQLGISKVTYPDIFKGKVSNIMPMLIHQQGILKAVHDVSIRRGNGQFISVSPQEILDSLKDTEVFPFIPKDGIAEDIRILANKGWLDFKGNNVLFSDYAKLTLYKIEMN